jgi:hypothetical protein
MTKAGNPASPSPLWIGAAQIVTSLAKIANIAMITMTTRSTAC